MIIIVMCCITFYCINICDWGGSIIFTILLVSSFSFSSSNLSFSLSASSFCFFIIVFTMTNVSNLCLCIAWHSFAACHISGKVMPHCVNRIYCRSFSLSLEQPLLVLNMLCTLCCSYSSTVNRVWIELYWLLRLIGGPFEQDGLSPKALRYSLTITLSNWTLLVVFVFGEGLGVSCFDKEY